MFTSRFTKVLRMLSQYVGEEKFLKGVSIYLKKHLYGNAIPEDLWAGISEATGVDVKKMMDNWTWKVCYSHDTTNSFETDPWCD